MSQDRERLPLKVRGVEVTEDANGFIRLDDIWELAKAKETRAPKKWRATEAAKRLILALQKKVTSSALKANVPGKTVIYAKPGRGNRGTFAHPVLAAAYAGYLRPELEIEVREVWLRYRAGDATLADDILQRASAEANQWAGVRAMARAQRNSYTDVLKMHGVVNKGYMYCTERLYQELLGGKSFQIRSTRGLPKNTNLRNHFDVSELSYVMASEALAADRIEEEGSRGNTECVEATGRSARYIREAIERDRQDRQKRMM